MISPAQIRAARAMLRIGQQELAESAGVSVDTIKRIEGRGGGSRNMTLNTAGGIKRALEDAGARFFEDDEREGVSVAKVAE